MGFPDDYGWPEHATRRECQRGLGNAVCPPVARKLLEPLAA
jgi:site-specific DNA-cytosine methylase